jgi:hypothetical protein
MAPQGSISGGEHGRGRAGSLKVERRKRKRKFEPCPDIVPRQRRILDFPVSIQSTPRQPDHLLCNQYLTDWEPPTSLVRVQSCTALQLSPRENQHEKDICNGTTANTTRNLANLTNQEQWMGLCELASKEQDQDKLGVLFEGMLCLLEDEQARLNTAADGLLPG